MTIEQLNKCTGFSSNQFLQPINDTLEKYNINTPLRIAHFISQILTESGNLTTFIENLSYSTNALLKTFPTHFNTTTAPLFAFKPQQIANIVYANRYGNGDSASGDGWNYRGRGAIQITFKANYLQVMKDLNLNYPDSLATLPNAILSAGWFWNRNKLNVLADQDDIVSITKKINCGLNGLDTRKIHLTACKAALM